MNSLKVVIDGVEYTCLKQLPNFLNKAQYLVKFTDGTYGVIKFKINDTDTGREVKNDRIAQLFELP